MPFVPAPGGRAANFDTELLPSHDLAVLDLRIISRISCLRLSFYDFMKHIKSNFCWDKSTITATDVRAFRNSAAEPPDIRKKQTCKATISTLLRITTCTRNETRGWPQPRKNIYIYTPLIKADLVGTNGLKITPFQAFILLPCRIT